VLVLLPIALIDPLLGLLAGVGHAPALSAALARVGELEVPTPRESRPVLPEPVTSLVLDDVAAEWPDAADSAFAGASAIVTTGEWLVVDGPSGSGKSTLLSVLLGALPASAGSVQLNGTDAAGLDVRQHVAWCPQEAHLFDSTIRANLLLGRSREDRPTEGELLEALDLAGLGHLVSRLPEGLDARIGSQGSHLSGGERQRLAVARALLSRADVILLDEPTAHLDEETARVLMADLREALADRIVVLVTHRADDRLASDERLSLGAALVR
jgi:ATP-binding cassette subfamily C protein CydCD